MPSGVLTVRGSATHVIRRHGHLPSVMSATDTATTDPEPTEPDIAEEPAAEHEDDSKYDVPTPGGLRGLV